MLLLSHPTWHVGLSERRLVLARAAPPWARRSASCESVPCTPNQDIGPEPWRAVLGTLARWLSGLDSRPPTLRVVLSGCFVRWQLLPWRNELTQPQEMAAYAALRFREVYGAAADHWRILYAAHVPGRSMPACAVDIAMMEAIRGACLAAGARLATVTPYFSSAFGHWQRDLDSRAAWFGVVEPDCLSLGLMRRQNWLSLRTERLEGDWREGLARMMAQAGIAADPGQVSPPLYLAGMGERPERGGTLPFSWLQPRAGGALRDCRLAFGV